MVGLEVHAQVLARTKLFSEGKTLFNGPPNSQVSVIDAALPGVLPYTNEKVVQQAVRILSPSSPLLLLHSSPSFLTSITFCYVIIPDQNIPGTELPCQPPVHLRAQALLLLRPAPGVPDNPAATPSGVRGVHHCANTI